jgi:hypothetical protein
MSSIPPNAQSNTVCPNGTSSNGFKTDTVQSSLLEKGEKTDPNIDKYAQMGIELAR